ATFSRRHICPCFNKNVPLQKRQLASQLPTRPYGKACAFLPDSLLARCWSQALATDIKEDAADGEHEFAQVVHTPCRATQAIQRTGPVGGAVGAAARTGCVHAGEPGDPPGQRE